MMEGRKEDVNRESKEDSLRLSREKEGLKEERRMITTEREIESVGRRVGKKHYFY